MIEIKYWKNLQEHWHQILDCQTSLVKVLAFHRTSNINGFKKNSQQGIGTFTRALNIGVVWFDHERAHA